MFLYVGHRPSSSDACQIAPCRPPPTGRLRQRIALGDADDGQLVFEGFYSYLLPQFEGIDAATGDRLFATLAPRMGSTVRKERLRVTLNTVLGLELQPPNAQTDELEDESAVEQPEP